MNEIIIKTLLAKLPDLQAIYRFGSSDTTFARPDSDIDIAILPKNKLSLSPWQLAEDLAYTLKKDVDLVDLLSASTVMRFEIISTAKRIYCKDRESCETFEDYVYSAYALFNEERKDLLADILQRGTIL